MLALLWKKKKELFTKKIRLVISLIIPLCMSIWCSIMIEDKYELFYIMPIINIIFVWISLYSVEDVVYVENLLSTSIRIKDIWLSGIIGIAVVSFINTFIQAVVTISINNIVINIIIIKNMIYGTVTALALVLLATMYIANNKKILQQISSIIGIVNMLILVVSIYNVNIVSKYSRYDVIALIGIIVIVGIYYLFDKVEDNESFVNNSQKISTAYMGSMNIEE